MTQFDDRTETLAASPAHGEAQRVGWRLSIVSPPECVQSRALEGPTVTIGRGSDPPVSWTIPRGTVSRVHLELVQQGLFWAVCDRGSRNGTWMDGVLVGGDLRPLRDGSVIRFGDVVAVGERVSTAATDHATVSTASIPGHAPAAVGLRVAVARAAGDPSPVLIQGETGTGKELVAAELHRLSGRRGPLVRFNCAELSPSVIESQLFGHERGAFTGASAASRGLFRAADGGTLFLDELGELPLELQPKLLRVVQEGVVRPLGGQGEVRVDVRIVSATNRDLERDVSEGRFRRDLLARLSLLRVEMPPLRQRRSDIMEWVRILAQAWAARRGVPIPHLAFHPEAVEALLLHPWPDNLRGLDRRVHGLAPRPAGPPIVTAELGLEPPSPPSVPPAAPVPASSVSQSSSSHPSSSPSQSRSKPAIPSREELLEALEAHDWVVRAVARAFGRDRRQVYRWMETYELTRPGT